MHIDPLQLLASHFAVEDVLPQREHHWVVGTLCHGTILVVFLIEAVLVPRHQLAVWKSVAQSGESVLVSLEKEIQECVEEALVIRGLSLEGLLNVAHRQGCRNEQTRHKLLDSLDA